MTAVASCLASSFHSRWKRKKPAEIAGFLRIERGSGQLPAAVAGSSKK
jgi:hypothetical protein